MTLEQFEEGLAYARNNFLEDTDTHLWLDKKVINEAFNLDSKEVLDFGCGMGGMSIWYAKNWDCNVHGIDIDSNHITIAKALQKEFSAKNVTFLKKDILDIDSSKVYDIIFLNDVIEHIHPLCLLEKIIHKLTELLKPGGIIYVSYPPWQGPYASHINSVLKLPWCQFLPESFIVNYLKKHNKKKVGSLEDNLLKAYRGLNKMTHEKFMAVIDKTNLCCYYRNSHTILNQIRGLENRNLNIFPFIFLVTKEVLFLKQAEPDAH